MKVKDLVKEIVDCQNVYPDFLEWDVYTEQINEIDKKEKLNNPQWKHIKDGDDWVYFECAGFWTRFPKQKIFTINVNY